MTVLVQVGSQRYRLYHQGGADLEWQADDGTWHVDDEAPTPELAAAALAARSAIWPGILPSLTVADLVYDPVFG